MNPLHAAARRNHEARLGRIEDHQEAMRLLLGSILKAATEAIDGRGPAPSGPPRLTVVGRE